MNEHPRDSNAPPFAWQVSVGIGMFVCGVMTLMVAVRVIQAMVTRVPGELIFDHLGGAVIDHAYRVHQGLPIYCEPNENFFSLLYTPIYYYFCAAMMTVVDSGPTACRSTSVVLVGLTCVVAMGTGYRLTRAWWVPVFVLALTFAGYGRCEYFYDGPRVDPAVGLMVMLSVSAALLIRSTWGGVAVGVGLALAFWSKQSSGVFAAVFLLGLLLDDWRRAFVAGAVYAGTLGGTLAAANRITDGWFWTFVMELPATHSFPKELFVKTMLADWLGPLLVPGLAVLAMTVLLWRRWKGSSSDRAVRVLIVAFSAGAAFLAASRTNAGGATNNLIPICLVMSLVLPVGCWWVVQVFGETPWQWHVRLGVTVLAAVLIRGGFFEVSAALPDGESVERWGRLKETVDRYAAEGQVWVVPWGHLTTTMEGQAMRPVMMIVNDYLGGWFGPPTGHRLPADLVGAIEGQRFAAIFYPLKWGHRDLERVILENYVEEKRERLFPKVGLKRVEMPIGVFVPRGR